MKPLQVMIGFDPRQPVAFQVAAQSVWEQASSSVSITRLDLRNLPITRKGLTEFTYSRFIVPWLSGFEGISIFMDSDVLVRGDVAELIGYALAYPACPVLVVKSSKKFEWASVMVFNNALCKELTPEFVNCKTYPLLKFEWCDPVGELPKEWNHLVGYQQPNPDAKLVHFTAGLPIWSETKECEYSKEWHEVARRSMSSVSYQTLMGHSVHELARQTGALSLKVGA